jgi:hypothetical protein
VNRAHAAALTLTALTFAGCGVKPIDPTFEPSWGAKTEVWFYVASRDDLSAACRDGVLPRSVVTAAANARPPVTLTRNRFDKVDILVPEDYVMSSSTDPLKPYSCVGGVFFEHDDPKGKHEETVVKLSLKSATHLEYRSITPFKVLELKPVPSTAPTKTTAGASQRPAPVAPAFPFFVHNLKLPTEAVTTQKTGPIDFSLNRVGLHELRIRYKAVFEVMISGTWVKIDPDIECRFKRIKI